ncbi:alkaline phosphatase family protein [Haloarcula pellucida]|uniref:Nucleotide pyrophosphatase n=1 Tax=Haloarcula pellucida TaxID=1427151 RepID=A0A830GI70_9EURY|nr:alkaline phosphatase family protein [Halomicroarcula pellucida]MBX0347346.1 alkaline phosphatase family protein [Halomicroarcula pellucida]GGN88204.1 nucleotide pyrophosphatase [Halomicroarcula pellucida]
MRTLLLGLDGTCRSVLDPLFEADVTPTLSGLFEESASGPLTSQLPPWTPSAWPSLYTGVNPGKHGVYGFLRFDGYDHDVVDATDVRARALWELLDHHGHSSVVVNVPVTAPASAVDGAVIPGYVSPEDPPGHPEGVLDDVRDAIGSYTVYGPMDTPGEAELADVAAHAKTRGDAFAYLVDRFDPDFGFLEFQQTDTVFHRRPEDTEAVECVFGAVDDAVATALDAADPDNVLVVSDHGIGPYDGHEIRVNECLRDWDLLETTTGGEGMPSWDAIARRRLQQGESGGTPDPGLLERGVGLLARAGVTSQRVEAVLEPLGLAEVVARIAPTDAVRAGTEQVDFRASQAYMRDRIELGVRLNLAGREPDGVVQPDAYESTRREVIDRLATLEDPDGNPVFEEVFPREAVFDGPYVEDAPDVLVVPRAFENFLNGSLLGEWFGTPREPWNHKRDGVLAATGPAVDTSASLADAHLFDVAPTVLSTFGVPRDERMDGTPLPIVDPTPVEQYPDYETTERRVRDDHDVADRLANLGYLSDGE